MIILINHQEQFERLKERFEELEIVYNTFKNKQTKTNRQELELEINIFRQHVSALKTSIKNMWL